MLKSLIDFAIERRVTIVMFTVAIALLALTANALASPAARCVRLRAQASRT